MSPTNSASTIPSPEVQPNSGEATHTVIVVGVDRSSTARAAADRAAQLARSQGARLHLVSALKSGSGHTINGPGGDVWIDDPHTTVQAELVDLAAQWTDVETTTAVIVGKPAEVIVDEANKVGASVIVVGNRRMHGIARLLGAVASDVAHSASCDVYIVNTVG